MTSFSFEIQSMTGQILNGICAKTDVTPLLGNFLVFKPKRKKPFYAQIDTMNLSEDQESWVISCVLTQGQAATGVFETEQISPKEYYVHIHEDLQAVFPVDAFGTTLDLHELGRSVYLDPRIGGLYYQWIEAFRRYKQPVVIIDPTGADFTSIRKKTIVLGQDKGLSIADLGIGVLIAWVVEQLPYPLQEPANAFLSSLWPETPEFMSLSQLLSASEFETDSLALAIKEVITPFDHSKLFASNPGQVLRLVEGVGCYHLDCSKIPPSISGFALEGLMRTVLSQNLLSETQLFLFAPELRIPYLETYLESPSYRTFLVSHHPDYLVDCVEDTLRLGQHQGQAGVFLYGKLTAERTLFLEDPDLHIELPPAEAAAKEAIEIIEDEEDIVPPEGFISSPVLQELRVMQEAMSVLQDLQGSEEQQSEEALPPSVSEAEALDMEDTLGALFGDYQSDAQTHTDALMGEEPVASSEEPLDDLVEETVESGVPQVESTDSVLSFDPYAALFADEETATDSAEDDTHFASVEALVSEPDQDTSDEKPLGDPYAGLFSDEDDTSASVEVIETSVDDDPYNVFISGLAEEEEKPEELLLPLAEANKDPLDLDFAVDLLTAPFDPTGAGSQVSIRDSDADDGTAAEAQAEFETRQAWMEEQTADRYKTETRAYLAAETELSDADRWLLGEETSYYTGFESSIDQADELLDMDIEEDALVLEEAPGESIVVQIVEGDGTEIVEKARLIDLEEAPDAESLLLQAEGTLDIETDDDLFGIMAPDLIEKVDENQEEELGFERQFVQSVYVLDHEVKKVDESVEVNIEGEGETPFSDTLYKKVLVETEVKVTDLEDASEESENEGKASAVEEEPESNDVSDEFDDDVTDEALDALISSPLLEVMSEDNMLDVLTSSTWVDVAEEAVVPLDQGVVPEADEPPFLVEEMSEAAEVSESLENEFVQTQADELALWEESLDLFATAATPELALPQDLSGLVSLEETFSSSEDLLLETVLPPEDEVALEEEASPAVLEELDSLDIIDEEEVDSPAPLVMALEDTDLLDTLLGDALPVQEGEESLPDVNTDSPATEETPIEKEVPVSVEGEHDAFDFDFDFFLPQVDHLASAVETSFEDPIEQRVDADTLHENDFTDLSLTEVDALAPILQTPPEPPAHALPMIHKRESVSGAIPYQVGERVKHTRYGHGTVQKVIKMAPNQVILNITFEHIGKRLLDPQLTPLDKVS